jgi:hypothetical protein
MCEMMQTGYESHTRTPLFAISKSHFDEHADIETAHDEGLISSVM